MAKRVVVTAGMVVLREVDLVEDNTEMKEGTPQEDTRGTEVRQGLAMVGRTGKRRDLYTVTKHLL